MDSLGMGSEQDYAIAERVAAVAERLGCKPAQVALAWVLGLPGVTAPIVGASKAHHLDDAVGALRIQLDPQTRAHLEEPYAPRTVSGHSFERCRMAGRGGGGGGKRLGGSLRSPLKLRSSLGVT